MSKHIHIHTDGSCLGNGQASSVGGWAAVLENGTHQLRISAGVPQTTNQKMELTAAIQGLKALKVGDVPVTIFTDSRYVQQGATEWLPKWKQNGWRTSAKKPVENVELWRELDGLLQRLSVIFTWIKGHSGNPMNELADRLARKACQFPTQRIARHRRMAGDIVCQG